MRVTPYIFTKGQRAFIRKYAHLPYKEIIRLSGEKYGCCFPFKDLNQYCRANGLKKTQKTIDPTMADFIRSLMPLHHAKVAAAVNAKYGTNYNRKTIGVVMFNFGIKSGLKNDGETQNINSPIGREKITFNGGQKIWVIKTAQGWKHKNRVIWEQAHGAIPLGYNIIYLDTNTENCTLENLAMVNDSVHGIMSKNGLYNVNPEITKIGITIAEHKSIIVKMAGNNLMTQFNKKRLKAAKEAETGKPKIGRPKKAAV